MNRLKGKSDVDRNHEKNRSIAQYLSLIAGLGHVYLRMIKTGFALFGLFLFSILLFLLSYLVSATDVHTAEMFFVYGITAMTFSTLWSSILISDACDEMNLSLGMGLLRNYYTSNVQRSEKILMICTSIWLIIVAFLFILSWNLTDLQWIWIGLSLLSIILLYFFATKKREEKEFVRLFL